MLGLSPTTALTPALLTSVARLLANERAFSARASELFGLLQNAIPYLDGRLVRWVDGNAARDEFRSPDHTAIPWNEDITIATTTASCPRQERYDPAILIEDGEVVSPELMVYSAPLRWAGQLYGVFELRATNEFSSSQIDFLAGMLPLLSAATANGEQHRSELALPTQSHQLTVRQSVLLESFNDDLEAPLALGALLERVLHWALDSTGAEAGSISLVDHERGELIVQVFEGYPREPFSRDVYGEARRRWSWSNGLPGKVAREGRPLLLRDASRDPDFAPAIPEIRAELAVPIGDQRGTLAVLVLDSPRFSAFGEREIAFVRALAAATVQPLRRALGYQHSLETSMQLGQVFGSIPSGLALMDSQGKVLRHNAAWLSVWGLEPQDVHETFHVPWDLVTRLLARLADPIRLSEFCATGQSQPTDIHQTTILLREPHQELQVLSAPTRDSLGQLTGRLWVVSDVTREREADRLKSEFISIVSHELRTPLTSILGYTELMLAREFKPNEQREFVKTVYDQANHLSQIVEDLLGISRLEAGTVRLNQWVVSLRQLIGELIAQLNTHISNRHRVVIDVPQRLTPAYLDRDKIKQVLVNLVTNAIKYSPRGGEIVLSVREDAELPADHPPGHFLLVSVSDQGIGIPTEDLPRIWERFYRVDNSNTRRIGGTGLGLSITKSLVELHGGQIWAESVVGKGSTFYFTVPAAVDLVQRQP